MMLELLGIQLVVDSMTLAGLAVAATSALAISALGRRRQAMVPVRARRTRGR